MPTGDRAIAGKRSLHMSDKIGFSAAQVNCGLKEGSGGDIKAANQALRAVSDVLTPRVF